MVENSIDYLGIFPGKEKARGNSRSLFLRVKF